ncbi:hypothetical protein JM654_23640 [Microbacterium oxydans]|nr:hypothetical protein [Microbacterium oxydans]
MTVLVDMARWEIQLRQRKGATNWRADNASEDNLPQVQARLLRGMAHRRPSQARPVRHGRLRARRQCDLAGRAASGFAGGGMITGAAFRQALKDAARLRSASSRSSTPACGAGSG